MLSVIIGILVLSSLLRPRYHGWGYHPCYRRPGLFSGLLTGMFIGGAMGHHYGHHPDGMPGGGHPHHPGGMHF